MFETRWCLSYLRGPLTRAQIKALMDQRKRETLDVKCEKEADSYSASSNESSAPESRPILPPDVPQYFVPFRGSKPVGRELVYMPMLLGSSLIRFVDAKAGVDAIQNKTVLAPISEGVVAVDWDHGVTADGILADLEQAPDGEAGFLPLPASARRPKSYSEWSKEFGGWLFRTQKMMLLKSPSSKTTSKPGESERDFRVRLQQGGREERDTASEALRRKYASKIAALQERIRRAEMQKEKQETEARSSQVEAAISVGASILGAFLGRKTISPSNLGRATTAIRSAGRVMKESQDVGQASENVVALQQQLADLEAQFKSERDTLAAVTDPLHEPLESISIKLSKSNIAVKLIALAWTPYWRDHQGMVTAAWQ